MGFNLSTNKRKIALILIINQFFKTSIKGMNKKLKQYTSWSKCFLMAVDLCVEWKKFSYLKESIGWFWTETKYQLVDNGNEFGHSYFRFTKQKNYMKRKWFPFYTMQKDLNKQNGIFICTKPKDKPASFYFYLFFLYIYI